MIAPCPFCGAANCAVAEAGDDCATVRCYACGIHGPVRNTRREAIEAWNRRDPVRPWMPGPSEVKHAVDDR